MSFFSIQKKKKLHEFLIIYHNCIGVTPPPPHKKKSSKFYFSVLVILYAQISKNMHQIELMVCVVTGSPQVEKLMYMLHIIVGTVLYCVMHVM